METKYTNEQLAQDYFDVKCRHYSGDIRDQQAAAKRIKTCEIDLADFYRKNQTLKNNDVGIGDSVGSILEDILRNGKDAVIQKCDDQVYHTSLARSASKAVEEERRMKIRKDVKNSDGIVHST